MLVQIESPKDKSGIPQNRNEKVHIRGKDLFFDKDGSCVDEVDQANLDLLSNMGYTWTHEITAVRVRQNNDSRGGTTKFDHLYTESLQSDNARLIEERNAAASHAASATKWADSQKDKIAELEGALSDKARELAELQHTKDGMALEIERLKSQLPAPAPIAVESEATTPAPQATSSSKQGQQGGNRK